jgi:hypothetical protein
MNKRILCIAFLTLALTLPALTYAGTKDEASNGPWIHIEVREHGGDAATVNVNLPIALADVALDMVEKNSGEHPRFSVEDGDISVQDMRRMWDEVRKAGDAEFVTAKDGDETVSVYRKGESVFVNVDGQKGGEKVRIELPVAVVDALLGGTGDELDVAAAVDKMKDMKKGEIVRVEDGEDTVRIWID